MAAVGPSAPSACAWRASSIATKQPSAVASLRPAEPPSGIGLPVTTPRVEKPCVIEKVSMIQAMSGRRVDVRRWDVLVGPEEDRDLGGVAARHALVLVHRQLLGVDRDAALGAAEGMFTTAHFQVIHMARALTSSIVTPGGSGCRPWTGRARSSAGPVAGEDLIFLSSIFTGIETVSCRLGWRRTVADSGVEAQMVGGAVELALRELERVEVLGSRAGAGAGAFCTRRRGGGLRVDAWMPFVAPSRTVCRSAVEGSGAGKGKARGRRTRQPPERGGEDTEARRRRGADRQSEAVRGGQGRSALGLDRGRACRGCRRPSDSSRWTSGC